MAKNTVLPQCLPQACLTSKLHFENEFWSKMFQFYHVPRKSYQLDIFKGSQFVTVGPLCIAYCHMKTAPPMNTFDFDCTKNVHRWCCFHLTIRDTERANCDKLTALENVKLVTFPWNMIKLEHFLTRIHFQNGNLMWGKLGASIEAEQCFLPILV